MPGVLTGLWAARGVSGWSLGQWQKSQPQAQRCSWGPLPAAPSQAQAAREAHRVFRLHQNPHPPGPERAAVLSRQPLRRLNMDLNCFCISHVMTLGKALSPAVQTL